MNKALGIILAATLSLGLASCSIFGNQGIVTKASSTDSTDEQVRDVLEEVADQTSTSPAPQPTTPVQTPAVAPAQPAPAPVQTAPAESAKPKKADKQPVAPVSKLIGKIDGEWIIIEAGKHHIKQDDDMPYLIFEENTGRFYASNGCNIVNGNFSLQGSNEIEFSKVLSTKMSCPEIKYAQDISVVLRDGAKVKVEIQAKGREWYMKFRDAGGNLLLTLRKHNMEELNGQWNVSEIAGNDADIVDANIFLDIAELTVHGNTGCNHFNGIILIDPQVANSISFSQIGATQRLCENSGVEMAMLVALEQVSNFKLSGRTLHLLDSHGHNLITLER